MTLDHDLKRIGKVSLFIINLSIVIYSFYCLVYHNLNRGQELFFVLILIFGIFSLLFTTALSYEAIA